MKQVRLPNPNVEVECQKYYDENGELGGFGDKGVSAKMEVIVRMNHSGEGLLHIKNFFVNNY